MNSFSPKMLLRAEIKASLVMIEGGVATLTIGEGTFVLGAGTTFVGGGVSLTIPVTYFSKPLMRVSLFRIGVAARVEEEKRIRRDKRINFKKYLCENILLKYIFFFILIYIHCPYHFYCIIV
jgi:hypothetical protein